MSTQESLGCLLTAARVGELWWVSPTLATAVYVAHSGRDDWIDRVCARLSALVARCELAAGYCKSAILLLEASRGAPRPVSSVDGGMLELDLSDLDECA